MRFLEKILQKNVVILKNRRYTYYQFNKKIIVKEFLEIHMRLKKIFFTFSGLAFLMAGGIFGCDKIPFFNNKDSAKDQKFGSAVSATPPTVSPAKIEDPNTPLPSNVLAKVGDWTLTVEDFQERLRNLKELAQDFDPKDPKSKKLILDELVNQQLLVKEAEQKGVASKKEIVEAVDEFKRTLLVRETINKLVENIQATEAEAQDYYNQNKETFVEPAEWQLREIVVPTPAEAKEILIELLKGTDFTEMAKTRSKSKSAPQGGDLGTIKDLQPFMARAMATLEVGDISSVFKGPDGYYLVKLVGKKGGKPIGFTEIKKDLITGLKEIKQRDVVLKHIAELKQGTIVKVNDALLEQPKNEPSTRSSVPRPMGAIESLPKNNQ